MKPDWKDAPEGAMWLAQDADGLWGWYRNEPNAYTAGSHGFWSEPDGSCFADAGWGDENPNWLESCEPRP